MQVAVASPKNEIVLIRTADEPDAMTKKKPRHPAGVFRMG